MLNFAVIRIIQLLRPFLLLVALRYLDINLASKFVALISVYVLTLEVYNLVAPTDGLYLPGSKIQHYLKILFMRIRISPLIIIPVALFINQYFNYQIIESISFSVAIFFNALIISYVSFAYSRSSLKLMIKTEICVWLCQILAIFIIIKGVSILYCVMLYCLEMFIRSYYMGGVKFNGEFRIIKFLWGCKRRYSINYSEMLNGGILTLSNHIYRIPFVMNSEKLDPIFLIAAQVSSAFYSLLLGMGGKVKFPKLNKTYIMTTLILIVLFVNIPIFEYTLYFQLVTLVILATLHGGLLSHLPGRYGLLQQISARKKLSFGLILVLVCSLKFGPIVFLFTPIVLAVTGLIEQKYEKL